MDRDLGCSNNKQHRMDARPWTGGVFTGREKERSTIGDRHGRLCLGWMEKACCAQTQGLVPFGLDRTPRLLPWQSCPPQFFFDL